MNCANHPETPATAYCRQCGKAMCTECQRPALGSIYCAEHAPGATPPPPAAAAPEAGGGYAGSAYSVPPSPPYTPVAGPSPYSAPAGSSPYTAPPATPAPGYETGAHPVLALLLGFIPGVGAIYNGQYAKGLIHAVVFGLLVSIVTGTHDGSLEPLFALLIAAWVFYMAFEAYHTASKRRQGVPVEEFSSFFDVRPAHGRFPAGAILLIVLGFILLLDTTDIISMDQLERYWPVGLILIGLYMLYARLSPAPHNGDRGPNRKAEAPK